ncbi:PHP domain-containing protein [Alkalilimnicola sp. S0819]|uniref:PHP domain-containing protein n=1 Tax=Alkalilimnicola sp. S0819 TaxID=2613922 RepID=UPI0012627A77|nr:PHP domain-containing protein [Alkalilimnicola sp. S0819]KAB7623711.1 PHP domain-containing protein [Alkalilimnicola sp. S0819]MPQ16840.1 PHP domain-containing protein [Alkalilimnicola sp. S0819]
MPPRIDLHCHSTASDGTLAPAELVRRAAGEGVELLALTDHDTMDGVPEAAEQARREGIRLLPAAELSVDFRGRTLHVVGLNMDPDTPVLREGLARLQALRAARGEAIGRRLEQRCGLEGATEAARAVAGEAALTRSHYARALVAAGHVPDAEQAFKRYLKRGRPAYVRAQWVPMAQALDWIREAGGLPVLAHPLGYGFTGAWLRRVLEAFVEAGGVGLEVVAGRRTQPRMIEQLAGYCHKYSLMGSVGSDFHHPGNPFVELGRLPPLPAGIRPVWEAC